MRIMLVCNAGMSTSMVVTRMEKAAKTREGEYKIWAVDIDSVDEQIGKFDVLLIGPQIQYKMKTLKRITENTVPIEIIDPVAYGCCDGEKILCQAEEMFEKFNERRDMK